MLTVALELKWCCRLLLSSKHCGVTEPAEVIVRVIWMAKHKHLVSFRHPDASKIFGGRCDIGTTYVLLW